MKIRERGLPEGWYPGTERGIRDRLSHWTRISGAQDAIAGVVPHAGWEFCGSKIASVLAALADDIETVVVLGGHNPAGGPFIIYDEDVWDLPAGRIRRDAAFARRVEELLDPAMSSVREAGIDNTVEVVMAMVSGIRPRSEWAAWRIPADRRAILFGEVLAEAAARENRKIAVVGSTDLTHYGPNYGFMPAESRDEPLLWVEERDRRLLEAMISGNAESALDLAGSDQSACSIGGAVAAMSYAEAHGGVRGQLLSYGTSHDMYPSSSFVGYGAVVWVPE